MRTQVLAVAGLVTLLPAVSATPVWAGKGDMQIRFGLVDSFPTDDLAVGGQTTELEDELGFQAGFEYRLNGRIGLEPALSSVTHDVTFKEAGFPDLELGEISLVALTGNVNFHLVPDARFDLYVGPTIGYALWGDLETDVQDFSTDDELVYGINGGVDVPFGESQWAFSGAFSYLFVDVTLEGSSADIGVDPIQLKVGVSYSF